MDQKIERTPCLADRLECPGSTCVISDIARQNQGGAKLCSQRFNALSQCVALEGERNLRALGCNGFRDAPSDGPIIRDPHDKAAFTIHDQAWFSHSKPLDAV